MYFPVIINMKIKGQWVVSFTCITIVKSLLKQRYETENLIFFLLKDKFRTQFMYANHNIMKQHK